MENNVEVINEEKKPKTPKELAIFIAKIVGNVIFYAVIIMLLIFSIMNIRGGNQKGGSKSFPNIFGRGFLVPISDSMDPSYTDSFDSTKTYDYVYKDKGYSIGTFAANKDLLNVSVFNGEDTSSLKVGDVITFYDEKANAGKGGLNTHRIIVVTPDGKSVITQGDKKAQELLNQGQPSYVDAPDLVKYSYEQNKYIEVVSVENIKGIVTSVNYGGAGFILWVQANWLWVFVLPVGLFLLFEIFMVVKNIMDLKGAKQKEALASDKEAMLADLEKEKEAMRQQILAELKAQQEAEAKKNEENSSSEE